jgi:endonuclease/exonuclease/phosphatase family metal-dependent hydrolase
MKTSLGLALLASGAALACSNPHEPAAAPPFELRVATFNAALAPGFAELTEERVEPVVSALSLGASDLDVLCVQEFWQAEHFELLRDRAAGELPYSVRKEPRPGSGSCGGEELLVLAGCLQASCAGASGAALVGCAQVSCAEPVTALTPGCLGCVLNHVQDDFSACVDAPAGSDPAMFGGAFDTGLLSRFAPLESDTRELHSYFVRVAALYAKLEVPGAGPVHVFCTHLGSELGVVPYGGKYCSWHDEQTQQIQELLGFVREKTHGSGRVLVLGDMNTGPEHGAILGEWPDNYRTLTGNGLEDRYLAQSDASCSWCPENSFHPTASPTLIDHILVSDRDDAVVTTRRDYATPVTLMVDEIGSLTHLSDHFGLRSVIRSRAR